MDTLNFPDTARLQLSKAIQSLLFDKAATMDDDELSVTDSMEVPLADPSSYDKQRASLQTYLNALPYECETIEDMQSRLEDITEKIYICAQSKNWLVLSTWDGMLQWYAGFVLRPNLPSGSLI